MKPGSHQRPATADVPAIEVRNLSKTFGSVRALDGVSFTVQPGELFFLLGPSGCGKTTLLRILAGLETPDEGELFFSGRDVSALPPHRRGAPMVFQNYALWPHLNVRDNVAFGLVEQRRPTSEIRARVANALDRVGLDGYQERLPSQLSGGQQQRVVLARCLVMNPSVILLDEPLSNLDARLRLEMREEIERIHRETGLTFVYVTHDQAEALSLADRMAVIESGRLCALGRPRELYDRPPNRFCAEFLGEANVFPATVRRIEAEGRAVLQTPWGEWQALFVDGLKAAPGDRVDCLVRPENLEPAGNAVGGNRLHARVPVTRMNGSTLTATLESEGGLLKAALLNRHGPALSAGGDTEWTIAPDHVVVLGPAADLTA